MKVLGLIGSARKMGNCEVLVKESLLAAQKRGAIIRAIRLPDYSLLPCKGCLACVLKGEPCRLDDDMHALWEHLQWADGLILSAPTYFLGPAGIIKLLIDRLFEYSFALGQTHRRPGSIIVSAGLQDWDPFTMPMLTMLAGILQLDIIGKMTAYRPGPAEVLLDQDTMARARSLGDKVVEALGNSTQSMTPISDSKHCPQCGTPYIRLLESNSVECILCQMKGQLRMQKDILNIKWDPTSGRNRWSPEALAEHFSEWVLKTGPVFQKHRIRIQELSKKYRQVEIEPKPQH